MRYPLAHKAASVLMAFVLVCTCNSAALQPLAAFAAQGDGAAAAEQEALTEASEAENAGEPEVAPAGEEGPAGAAEPEEGAEAPSPEGDGNGSTQPEPETGDEESPEPPSAEDDAAGVPPAGEESQGEGDPNQTDGVDGMDAPASPDDAQEPALGSKLKASEDPKNVTLDTEQLGINIQDFKYKKKGDDGTTPVPFDETSGTYEFPSPFESIGQLSLQISFSVLKNGDERMIEAGDYFELRLDQKSAEGLEKYFAIADVTEPQELKHGGVPIAVYTVEDNVLKVTFAESIESDDYYDIKGGVALDLALNADAFSGEDKTSIDVVLQDQDNPIKVVVPPKASVVDGVEKTGRYDPATRSIVWTIKAGTRSAGLSLEGMRIVDTFNADALSFASAATVGADGVRTSIEEGLETGMAGSVAYTFPAGAIAPQTIEITTIIAGGALPVGDDAKLANAVALEKGTSPFRPGDNTTPTATVTVPKQGLAKAGEQMGGDVMRWTIGVNAGDANWIWNAIVTDTLAANLELVKDSLKRDGTTIPVVGADDAVPTTDYALLTENPDGTHTLTYHFIDAEKDAHGDKPIISKGHVITFDTRLLHEGEVEDVGVANAATMTGSWPTFNGEGPGVDFTYGIGPVNTSYDFAYIRKSGEAELRTGVLTWTVLPQSRTDEFDTATIVDRIDPSDQDFIDGSVKLVVDGGDTYDQDALVEAGWLEIAISDATTLTFALPNGDFPTLSAVRIEYQTQATVGYLEGSTGTQHNYQNTANLTVTSNGGEYRHSAFAIVPLGNDLIGKSAIYEFDDDTATGYLHYKLAVNGRGMSLTDVVVEDDFSNMTSTYYANDGTVVEIPAAEKAWVIDQDKTTTAPSSITPEITYGEDGDTFRATFETLNASCTIHVYLKLTEEAKEKYLLSDVGSGYLQTKNTATITGKSGDNDVSHTAVNTTGPDSGNVYNKIVNKNSQLIEGMKDQHLIRWRVDVNPNAAPLSNASVEDVLNKALQLNFASVKLYESKHVDGSISPADPETEGWTPVDLTDRLSVKPGSNGSSVLNVTLPDEAKSYTLVYETAIVEEVTGNVVRNKASLVVGDKQTDSSTQQQELKDESWGYLKTMASYQLKKVDSLGDEAIVLAEGVRFGLYRNADCTDQINTVFTNADGVFKFVGLTPGETYYYQELTAPYGYQVDPAVHSLVVPENAKGMQEGVILVENDRTTSLAAVQVSKSFEVSEADTASFDKRATFALYLYPHGTGAKTPVQLTEDEENPGTYRYAGAGGLPTPMQTSVADESGQAQLSIEGLPWGVYDLVETATASGYALDGAAKRFSVNMDGTIEYSNDFGEGSSAELHNAKTVLSVKKMTDASKYLTGAVLTVYEAAEDGTKTSTLAKSPFTNDELTVNVTENVSEFTWDLTGIPVGTYWLCEDTMPDDKTVGQFEDVQFKIDAAGKLTVLNGKGTVAGSTLTVIDSLNQITVKKIDQWGADVAGAVLELQERSGSGPDFEWNTVVGTWTSSELDTSHTFGGLKRDATYRIVETTAPEGYAAANHDEQKIEFAIDKYGTVKDVDLHNGDAPDGALGNGNFQNANVGNGFTLRNERVVGHAGFVKKSDDGKPLAGVKFNLYQKAADSSAADELVNSTPFISGGDGKVTTVGQPSMRNSVTGDWMKHGLMPGTYYFKEVSTYSDFVFDSADPLVTDEFTISADDGRFTWSKDAEGKVSFGDVIAVTKGGGAVTNTPLDASVRVLKAADDGSALNGAVFTLTGTDANSKSVSMTAISVAAGTEVRVADSAGTEHVYTTINDGEALFANVPAGTYTVKETTPPSGYKLSTAELTVTVGQGTASESYILNEGNAVVNEQNEFTVSKQDAVTGSALSGATFKLEGEFADGTEDPIEWTSGEGAEAIKGKLVASINKDRVYTLTETSAPDHYVAANRIELKMDAAGQLYQRSSSTSPWTKVASNDVVVKNQPVRGHVALTKSIADGVDATVAGVQFSLYKTGAGVGGVDLLIAEGLATDAAGTWTSVGKSALENPDTGQKLDKGLAVGSYYFVETAATPDTVLDSDARHEFEIADGNHYATTNAAVACGAENKAFSASLKLDKLDGTSGEALAGAEFELTYTPAGGGAAQTIPLTDQGGTFEATDLKKGSYTLAETKVPTGYEGAFAATFELADADDGLELVIEQGAATFAGDVQKTAGSWTGAGVENARIPGSMSLAKVEAGTEEGLAGAEFQLTGPDGSTTTLTTGPDGKASASGLAWGEYRIAETKAPAGYQLGAEPYSATFAIGAENLIVDLGSVENAKTSISLAKTDGDGSPLAGAHLKLAGAFADGEREKQWTSENDAKVFEGLLIAGNTYTLTETDRLGGYLTWSGQVSFKLDDAGKVVLDDPADPAATVSAGGLGISLSNARIVASAELTKTRDGAGPLEGVTFDLYAEGADEPLERGLVTDAAGKVRVSGLPEGSYYFVETAAPDDAVVDGTHQTFSIGEQDHGKTVPITMDNSSFNTVVSLLKVDQTGGKALAGAQFALSKQAADGSFVPVGSPLATNEHGAVAFTLTERGTYRIQETQAAPGYVLDADKPYTATFTVENTAAFQGAELKLAEVVDPATVGVYGLVVENARYEGGKVANERKLGSVALAKVDGVTGAPLAGAEFELTGPDGSVATLSTGADGTLNVEGLAWGEYALAETKAPAGYRLGAQSYSATFEIGAHNADSTPSVDLGTVGNEPIEISFTKLERYVESCSDASLGAAEADATRPLEGAEFTAYDDEACTRVSQTGDGADMKARSGADGAVSFSPVKAGTHYLKETVVPDGRVSNDTVYRLDVAADGTVERFAPLGEDGVLDAVVNDVHRTDIRVKKVSETDEGKVLPNSTYGLFKRVAAPEARAASAFPGESDLQLIAKAVTDASGYLVFEGVLMDQEYVIEEIAAPDGSLVSKHPIALTFAVGDDGAPRLVSFDDGSGTAEVDENGDIVWKEPQVIVEFSKRDPDGALLAGATLQVVDEAGATVGEPWVSEADAGRRIEGVLVAGKTYRLVELAAPDGYIVAEDVSFTVEDLKRAPQEGYVQHVEMVDERVPTASGETPQDPKKTPVPKWLAGLLAKTGDAPLGALAAAVALGAAGVAGAVGVRRRRKRS